MNNNGTINILKFVAKTISECIIEITKDIDLSRAIEPLKPFIESIKEFKEIMEHVAPICQQKMFNSGWVPLLPPSAPIVEFVAEIASNRIDEDNIDEFIYNTLGSNDKYFNHVKRVLDRFYFEDGFNKTINEILNAYKEEKYCLVVTSTMPIIERLTSGEKYVNYKEIKEEQINLMSKLLDSKLGKDFLNDHLFKTITNRDQLTTDIIVSRHAVSHGFDFDFKKKKALNCIILIDYFLNVDTGYLLYKQIE